MEKQHPTSAALAAFETANALVEQQNTRYELSSTIEDDDFRELAVTGLEVEQAAARLARAEAYATLEPDSVMDEWDALLHAIEATQMQIAQKHAQLTALDTQMELAIAVSPASETDILQLAVAKTDRITAEIKQLEAVLDEMDARQAGHAATFAAWTIPLVPAVHAEAVTEHLPVPLETTTPEMDEAIAETTETTPAAQVEVEKEEPEEPTEQPLEIEQMRRIAWAVVEYVGKFGAEGVRLEQMRNGLPELTDLTQQQYAAFKNHFASMREEIEAKLNDLGAPMKWVVSGRTRGTRYSIQEFQAPANRFSDSSEYSDSARKPGHQITQPRRPSQTIPVSDETISADETPLPSTDSVVPTTEVTSARPSLERPTIEVASPIILHERTAAVKAARSSEVDNLVLTQIVKNGSGANLRSGFVEIASATPDELLRHLGCKKNPDLGREVLQWVEWLKGNPTSQASRKIRSLPGIRRREDRATVMPLIRFSPKDVPELTVRRQHMRHRVVYTMHDELPAILEVLDHESFDRKYK